MTAKPDKLLPCPFCGGAAEQLHGFYVQDVQCKACGAIADTDKWNTRAPCRESYNAGFQFGNETAQKAPAIQQTVKEAIRNVEMALDFTNEYSMVNNVVISRNDAETLITAALKSGGDVEGLVRALELMLKFYDGDKELKEIAPDEAREALAAYKGDKT